MYLLQADACDLPPFGDAVFGFTEADGRPRMATVIYGSGGVGKTTILRTIGVTRPGHAALLPRRGHETPPTMVTHWDLGLDDPERPHPLQVSTPNTRSAPENETTALRRREQALFDKLARDRGGFVFLTVSGARWFSKQATALSAPLRTVLLYDVRTNAHFDDASRSDLTRETKHALVYAEVSSALAPKTQTERVRHRERVGATLDTRCLGRAMHDVVDEFVQLAGFRYEGLDPVSLEPMFARPGDDWCTFDHLPTHVRHLVAFAALPVQVLWAAYPGRDPRTSPAVVAIDDVGLHQDDPIKERLIATLRRALPMTQWILTTSCPRLAASVDGCDVLALRKLPASATVGLFTGQDACTH